MRGNTRLGDGIRSQKGTDPTGLVFRRLLFHKTTKSIKGKRVRWENTPVGPVCRPASNFPSSPPAQPKPATSTEQHQAAPQQTMPDRQDVWLCDCHYLPLPAPAALQSLTHRAIRSLGRISPETVVDGSLVSLSCVLSFSEI